MASLFVIKGQDQGKRFELTEPIIGLGRDLAKSVRLRDTEVSRSHAEIRRGDLGEDFILVDLDSANGTYVNGESVKRHTLRSGDRIQMGRTLLIYTRGDDAQHRGSTHDVDIVVPSVLQDDGSRIIKSMGNEGGSQFFSSISPDESPWLARARSNLQIMYRTALAVSHTLDIEQLLGRIMDLIFEWVEADRGCILLAGQETNELVPMVRRNRPGIRADDRMSISRTIIDYVMNNREGVLTSDAREDQRWDAAGSIVKMGVREAIAVPMQGRYGIVGLIYIDTYTAPGHALQYGQVNKFSEEHLKLMIAIAHQAALAVEDTSYYSAMVQAERLAAIGQTIAGLSHHIKNILQGIRGGSFLIEEGLNADQPDVVRKGWGIVERNQEKISRLVLDMLTFSKEREPEMVPSDLNRVCSEVVELMQSRVAELAVKLQFQPQSGLPMMTFDPDGLHHAILNVVTNAIDACDEAEDGVVQVATRHLPAEGRVQVVVTDHGRGIPAADLPQIFNLFESNKGNRGTGLGLSVSRKILQEHGGEIRVTSCEGEGSEFVLELPAIVAATLHGS